MFARGSGSFLGSYSADGATLAQDLSPNLIERLWKFLKKHALSDWHTSFEAMQQAVANVLGHLDQYGDELKTLMSERFQLWPDEAWQACPTE